MHEKALITWVNYLAGEIGGQVVVRGSNIQLQPVSSKWSSITGSQDPVRIVPTPENVEDWCSRLRYVEKASAQVILASPVGYSCSLCGSSNGDHSSDHTMVVRLAFGLSLSTGPSCNCRYTAYYIASTEAVSFVSGSDRLFDKKAKLGSLDLKEKDLHTGVKYLLDFVGSIENKYRESKQVQEQVGKLNETLSNELRALERFYAPSSNEDAYPLGNLDTKLRGQDRVNVEYANKARDIIEKYRISVIFRPLSLGVIYCNVKMKKDAKTMKILLPFIDAPLVAQSFKSI